MIVNPVMYGGGKTYHIEADQFAQETGFPANGSAKAGEYVVSTSGTVVGAVRLLTADKEYTIETNIQHVRDVDDLPPLVRKKNRDCFGESRKAAVGRRLRIFRYAGGGCLY